MNEFDRGSSKLEEALQSPKVKEIMALAQEKAKELNSPFVGTEFLLFGIAEERGRVADVLAGMGVTSDRITSEIIDIGLPWEVSLEGIELTSPVEETLERALDEANNYGSSQISPCHLLLALVRMDGGMAKSVLNHLGIDLRELQRRIDRFITSISVAESSLT